MKKWIYIVKIKFHLNEKVNITCNLNWIFQFNSIQLDLSEIDSNLMNSNTLNRIWIISIKLNLIQQLKKNEMQIGGQGMENILVNMVFLF
jgi:hypothetical protein